MQLHPSRRFIVMFQSFFSFLAALTAGVPNRQKQGLLSVSLSVRETERETGWQEVNEEICMSNGNRLVLRCRRGGAGGRLRLLENCWSPKTSHLSLHNRHVCTSVALLLQGPLSFPSFILSPPPLSSFPSCLGNGRRSISADVLLH